MKNLSPFDHDGHVRDRWAHHFHSESGTGTPIRIAICKVYNHDGDITSGDGKFYWTIPEQVNGMNLVAVGAHVYTVSSSGAVNIMIHNATDGEDMLSVALTIDESEKDSSTAATPAEIDTDYDDVVTADEIRIDIDGAGTGAKGLEIRMAFSM